MENNNLEIYISKEASENLSKLLKENDYSCVRLSYVKSCCARGRLDIVLDNIKEKDLKHEYASIILVYNNEVSNNIRKVEIITKIMILWWKLLQETLMVVEMVAAK